MDKSKPKKVLEVGVGTGIHAGRVLESCSYIKRYVGVDVSKDMLKIATRRLSNFKRRVKLVEAEMYNLPFRTGYFDVVFCVATLHHVDNPGRGVDEIETWWDDGADRTEQDVPIKHLKSGVNSG